jgi:hypothetical protein
VGKHAPGGPWWGSNSNLPNNVAAGLDPVVQEGETGVADEIEEAHGCDCFRIVWKWDEVLLRFMTVRSFRKQIALGKIM